jgi:FkbM family methyltransferase
VSNVTFLKFTLLNLIARVLRPLYRKIRNKKNYQFINTEINRRFSESDLTLNNSIVIDLGANRGDFSSWAIRQGATVLAFEPDKKAFTFLVKRLGKQEHFHPVNAAVSDKTFFANLYFHKNRVFDPIGYSISSSLIEEKGNIDIKNFNRVFLFNLAELLKVFQVKLIKIDIEGSEESIWPIIEMYFTNIEFLLLEIHKTNSTEFSTKVKNFIKNNNLSSKWKVDWL